MAFILGALSAGVAAKRGLEYSVPDWGLWTLPMLACTAVGGIFLVLVMRVKRAAPREVEAPLRQDFRATEAYAGPVLESIARVSDGDQSSIRRDLATAIDNLEGRKVITPANARHARAAKLGFLAAQMSGSSLAP
jgi:uncharacterized protein YqfA (UPF0365 family)